MSESLIKNRAALATNRSREVALDILEAGIASVLPFNLMPGALTFDRARKVLTVAGQEQRLAGRLFVVGAGKAAGAMAETLETVVGADNICAGLVVDKAAPGEFRTSRIHVVQAGHPVPDSRGLAAARAILSLKSDFSMGSDDTLLCLISGGGSSLLPLPAHGLSLEDKQLTTRLLLASGADIDQLNIVRKHLSLLKGGRLARWFAPARIISLIISDVIGNDLSVIASGLTYPDPSTYSDALAVLERYSLLEKVPKSVTDLLKKGVKGELEETPKELENVFNYILGDGSAALRGMAEQASRAGLRPLIVTDRLAGETGTVAVGLAAEIKRNEHFSCNALLLAGETTPSLPPNPGKGGRNQHLAALMPIQLEGLPGDWIFASLGTDGSDYLEEAAGGMVDQGSLKAYRRKRPDYPALLKRFDSFNLLASLGHSLIVTGNTHTNVGDIMLFLR